ncbi:MAG: glutamate mutase L, partial [Caldilineaceae bacterium]|nr:glutamate mutase L [Caldilineaceae bacterium]
MDTLSAGTGQGAAGSILAIGVELNNMRACLLEPVGGAYRLAAWQALPRRSESSLTTTGIDLCRRLGEGIDRTLTDESTLTPLIESDDIVRQPPLEHVTVAASPRPHVRVWIAGLSLTQSMDAARDAMTGCPAHIIGYTVLAADVNATSLSDTMTVTVPDLVVIVGGFDDPEPATHQALVELGRLTGQVLARLAPAQRPAVIYAGNRWAAPHVAEAVQAAGGGSVEAVANVQPAPGLVHKAALAQACNFHYWRLSRRAAGFRELSRWVTSPGHIVSQEASFAQLVQAWMEIHGLA